MIEGAVFLVEEQRTVYIVDLATVVNSLRFGAQTYYYYFTSWGIDRPSHTFS